jgi:iron-sulfur cluster repair protein YtfE (RIC family)
VRHGHHDDPAVVRVLVDHVYMRGLGQELEQADGADPEFLHHLGETLEQHIRHEERVLFPRIEGELDADELAALTEALERAEAGQPLSQHHAQPDDD